MLRGLTAYEDNRTTYAADKNNEENRKHLDVDRQLILNWALVDLGIFEQQLVYEIINH